MGEHFLTVGDLVRHLGALPSDYGVYVCDWYESYASPAPLHGCRVCHETKRVILEDVDVAPSGSDERIRWDGGTDV